VTTLTEYTVTADISDLDTGRVRPRVGLGHKILRLRVGSSFWISNEHAKTIIRRLQFLMKRSCNTNTAIYYRNLLPFAQLVDIKVVLFGQNAMARETTKFASEVKTNQPKDSEADGKTKSRAKGRAGSIPDYSR